MNGSIGGMLVLTGLIIALAGLLVWLSPRLPFLGRLPGDLSFQLGSTHVFVPLATCLVVSILLSLLLSLFMRH